MNKGKKIEILSEIIGCARAAIQYLGIDETGQHSGYLSEMRGITNGVNMLTQSQTPGSKPGGANEEKI